MTKLFMEPFNSLATVSFYAVLAGLLACALLSVTVRNLFHAAIYLAFTLLGVSVIYFFLRAEFLAGVQILIYVGAIMTLVIFAIMLTSRLGDPANPQTNRQRLPVLFLLLLSAFLLIPMVLKTPWKIAPTLQTANAVEIGKALMREFVFPFEIISLALLIALIGAIVIARSDQ
ncbi:MAG: NADH-quinone oxidoreductase subunit J [Candidatus Omnitrophica bacterium]|nr:NADH-quinone oxidoreductase subunit J [Candidatus Omnitrophota bacterium]